MAKTALEELIEAGDNYQKSKVILLNKVMEYLLEVVGDMSEGSK